MKQAQTTSEFLVLLCMILLIFLVAFSLYHERMENLKYSKALLSSKEIASKLGRTINQVYKGGNTTFHGLFIESRLANGERYSVTIRHRRVSVEWDEGVYQYPILTERVYFQGNDTFNISAVTQIDIATAVRTIGVGDGDNDGDDEIYAGIGGIDQENLYEVFLNESTKNLGGVGLKVFSICVADADPTKAGNEVYVGDADRHIYQYYYSGGVWSITDLGAQPKELVAMACGDGNNNGQEDIYYGVKNGDYVTRFSYSGGVWNTQNMGGQGFKIASLGVGDINSDGNNEVYAGDEDSHIYRYDWVGTWIITDKGEQSNDVIAMACGDGDSDARDELYFGIRNDANLYELTSNGSFVNHGGIGFKITEIDIGDVDQDSQGYNEIYIGDDNDFLYKFDLPIFDFIGEDIVVYNDAGVIIIASG